MSRNVGDPARASRPFDVDRDGFVLVRGRRLRGAAAARRRAWRPGIGSLGVVLGYGTNADAHHLVAPSPGGEGALRCMRLALADAGVRRLGRPT